MTIPPKVKQPHYVWRSYLEAWEVEKRLHVLRDGKYFSSAARGIAKQSGFYRLRDLTKDDLKFIEAVAIPKGAHQREGHLQLMRAFYAVSLAATTLLDLDLPLEHREIAEKAINDTEEDFHSHIEQLGMPWLKELQQGNIDFIKDEANGLFFYFLFTQYFRTKAMKTNMLQSLEGSDDLRVLAPRFEKCWPVFRHIHATDVAANVFAKRREFKAVMLHAGPEKTLITGDQPVINMLADPEMKVMPIGAEFYYPVTPNLALLYTPNLAFYSSDHYELGHEEIANYNMRMKLASLESIFADSKDALSTFM